MLRTLTEKERRQIHHAVQRATQDLSYREQFVARWIEEATLHGKTLDVKARAVSLKMKFSEFYTLIGRVTEAIYDEYQKMGLE